MIRTRNFFARMGRFFWSARILKIVLWTVTLVALFYVEEDWRGARLWAKTKAKWEARGETFEMSRLLPPPIREGRNLAALPLFQMEPDPNGNPSGTLAPLRLRQARRDGLPGGDIPEQRLGSWQRGESAPLRPFEGTLANRFQAIFKGAPSTSPLEQFDALFPCVNELRAAVVTRRCWRPDATTLLQSPYNFSLFTDEVPLSRLVAWQAILALNDRRSDVAFGDIALNDEVAAGLSDEPVLVTGLCAIAVRTENLCAIYNGLTLHAWNDGQLVELERRLGRIDYLATFQRDVRGERALAVGEWSRFYPFYWPRGWVDMNAARLVDFELSLLHLVDAKSHLVLVPQLKNRINPNKAEPTTIYQLDDLLPNVGQILAITAKHASEAQAWNDEARIACALERYRLVHRAYPGALAALIPADIETLPHDIMNGQPYRYRLRLDGTFLLYSVGWDQRDDGGKLALKADGSIDYEQGDWVWPTPK